MTRDIIPVNILNVGCSMRELIECIGVGMIPGFIGMDPRIGVSHDELKKISAPFFRKDEERAQLLNPWLAKTETAQLSTLGCTNHVFDFLIPHNGETYKIKLEAFSMTDIECAEPEIRTNMRERVANRLNERYDVLGFCEFCGDKNNLPEYFARRQDYDASIAVSAKEILNIIERKNSLGLLK